MPDGTRAGWIFTAPPGTTITAISYYRSLAAYNDPDLSAGLVQADGAVLEECRIDTAVRYAATRARSPATRAPFEFTGLNTSSLFFGVICRVIFAGGGCGAGGTIHAAKASMYSARVTLSESSLPALSGLVRAAVGGGVVSGVVPVTFSASDATGIKQQYVRADPGGVIAGATQTCDSMLAQPCPQLPAGSLSVDTRRVGDGPHTFSLVVVDAAGNQQTATSPTVVVRNQAAAVPPPAIAPPPPPPSSTAPRTRIRAVITGRRLRVTGSIARSGRVRVSWRSKRARPHARARVARRHDPPAQGRGDVHAQPRARVRARRGSRCAPGGGSSRKRELAAADRAPPRAARRRAAHPRRPRSSTARARRRGAAVAATLAIGAPAAAAAPTSLDVLSWSDEFNGPGLDTTRWAHRASGPRHDGVLTPDAVSVGGGVLTIKTYTEGGTHYSGMISTHRRGS